jgi:hypothetical protein
MTEAGGTTAVWSAPGKGTHVRLRVDAPSEAAGWIGFPMVWLARLRTSVAAAPSTAGADALAAPTFSWFAVAVLAYRVAVVPIVAVSSLAIVPGEIPPATLAVMLGPLLIANLALLIGALTGRLRGWLESNALLGVDILIAVAIDLWVSSLIRPGSFYLMGRDIFLAYPLSVVVLWTTLRGARTGLMLLAGTVLLELAMGVVNGVELDAISWPEFLSRLATSCLAVVLPLVVMSFARQGGRLQAAEGLRAGRGRPNGRGCCATPTRRPCTPSRRSPQGLMLASRRLRSYGRCKHWRSARRPNYAPCCKPTRSAPAEGWPSGCARWSRSPGATGSPWSW